MSKALDVHTVRRAVYKHVGRRVIVRTNIGRHKFGITEGIISETYPSIFIVKSEATKEVPVRVSSFSYHDVIAKDIELTLCS